MFDVECTYIPHASKCKEIVGLTEIGACLHDFSAIPLTLPVVATYSGVDADDMFVKEEDTSVTIARFIVYNHTK